MLNKVATHTNANPVLSSSKTGTVYSNLAGAKMWTRRKQRSIPVAGQKHMERKRATRDVRKIEEKEIMKERMWDRQKIRKSCLYPAAGRSATHNRRRVLSSVKRGRPPACQSVRPSIHPSVSLRNSMSAL
jgi:hypothetical protein